MQDRAAILFKIADRMEQNLELLATAETWDIDGTPIKIALLNNSVYGMVRQWQTLFYEHHYSATNLLRGAI